MTLRNTAPILLLFCLATCMVCEILTNFNAGACHVEMTCDESSGTMSQGRPGKRGAPGEKGSRGERGPKGEPSTVQEREILELKQLLKQQMEQKCIQTKFRFPRLAQIEDYIRVKTPIPEMIDVSICFWITVKFSTKGTAGIFSYAFDGLDNALLLFFLDPKRLRVHINNEKYDLNLIVEKKSHMCVAVSTRQQWAKVYMDGTLSATLKYSDSKPIPGGGAFIIGQEQDSIGGGLDATQAFSGTIENFMMWYRILSATEITALRDDACACPIDYGVGLRPEEIQLHGSVTAFPVETC